VEEEGTIVVLSFAHQKIDPEELLAMRKAFEDSTYSEVETLDFENCNLNSDSLPSIAAMVAAFPSLQELRLSGNSFSASDGLEQLFQSLPSSIRTLDMSWNPLGNEGALLMTDWLRRAEHLQSLTLDACSFDETAAATLLAAIVECADILSIQHLSLNDLYLTNKAHTEFLAGHLYQVLMLNKLTSISLNQCFLQSEGCRTVSYALREPSSPLKVLSLNRNKIGIEGIETLCSSLRSSSLQELRLSRNDILNQGAFHLANFIQETSVLRVLDLRACRIEGEGLTAILQALNDNHSLREVFLWDNEFDQTSLQALADLESYKLAHQASLKMDVRSYVVDERFQVCKQEV
jgi:Ran GTPase-activating protein (RanGAP) involved in mRNA processing and transport